MNWDPFYKGLRLIVGTVRLFEENVAEIAEKSVVAARKFHSPKNAKIQIVTTAVPVLSYGLIGDGTS